ncbi:MASE1 domain-containing protein [Novosphingobium rosa]|uniref:MASE1 domain-containing protein n=1 Tax=Novosphingobium rosa TaxID=76978 RepID=UPI000A00ED38|nr:MASE1 domain-containing protein [Novosphingobium rosa]
MNLMYGRDNTDTLHTVRYHGQLCLAAAGLYFMLAAATIHLASNGRDIATIWPANAVLLSLLLVHKRITWPGILTAGLVANAAANLLTRGTVLGPMLYGLCNIVEVVVAALVFGRGRALYTHTGLGARGWPLRFNLRHSRPQHQRIFRRRDSLVLF